MVSSSARAGLLPVGSLVLLISCSSSKAPPREDVSSSLDRAAASDHAPSSSDLERDVGRASDGVARDRAPGDQPTGPDAPVYAPYLLWQAPGGVTGLGAALEVLADGTVHLWKDAPQMSPYQTSSWASTVTLTTSETAALFGLLAAVDYGKLPHVEGPAEECSPSFYFELCRGCQFHSVNYYKSAASLSPEMDAVYAWLDAQPELATWASHSGAFLPGHYCFGP